MYFFMECAKLGLFVLVLLSGIIFCLEGCMTTQVRILHDEIPCVLTETHFGVWQGNALFEKTKVDCEEWGDEDWHPNLRTEQGEPTDDEPRQRKKGGS